MYFYNLNYTSEFFLYGNMNIIENLDVRKIIPVLGDIKVKTQKYTQWCIYCNILCILQNMDSYILDNSELYIDFIKFVERCLRELKNELLIDKIELRDKHNYGIIYYIIINLCVKKTELLNVSLLQKVKEYLNWSDKNEKIDIFIKRNLPYGKWSSKNIFVVNQEEIEIHELDIFLDNLFIEQTFVYTTNCKEFLYYLSERLNVIKTLSYYNVYINKHIIDVTKRIYETYPLKLIYNDYVKLDYPNIFYPSIYKKLDKRDNITWFFSILPETIRCYLVGVPVISCGCISEDLQINKINNYMNNKDIFYTNISNKNKKYVELITENLSCGNIIDNDEPCDVLYNKVYDYNLDDLLILFSYSTYHIFTASEFEGLLEKKQNPYNRQKLFYHSSNILTKLAFKYQMNKMLKEKEIYVNLNNNLKDNLENIFYKLSDNKELVYK